MSEYRLNVLIVGNHLVGHVHLSVVSLWKRLMWTVTLNRLINLLISWLMQTCSFNLPPWEKKIGAIENGHNCRTPPCTLSDRY